MKSARGRSRPAHDGEAEIDAHESSYGRDLLRLSSQIDQWRQSKRAALDGEFRQHGKLRAKAFPGRAAIPIRLLDLTEKIIGAVHEKPGSPKIGHYVPGTRIPILSDNEIPASAPRRRSSTWPGTSSPKSKRICAISDFVGASSTSSLRRTSFLRTPFLKTAFLRTTWRQAPESRPACARAPAARRCR
jgi:C-methyltransferase C-terminal domain